MNTPSTYYYLPTLGRRTVYLLMFLVYFTNCNDQCWGCRKSATEWTFLNAKTLKEVGTESKQKNIAKYTDVIIIA